MLLSLKQTSWLDHGDPRRGRPSPAIAFNAVDSSRFELYQGEPGIVLDPETTGTLLWQLGWPPDGAHLEDRGSGTVTVPS